MLVNKLNGVVGRASVVVVAFFVGGGGVRSNDRRASTLVYI